MKKALVFGFIVCLVLGTGLAANLFAAVTDETDVCESCKDTVGHIPIIPGTTNPQTGSTGSVCNPFDYDGDPDQFPLNYMNHGTYGYCSTPTNYNLAAGVLDRTGRNPKLIFKICNCDNATWFSAGKRVGVRMEILTKGVYFAAPNTDLTTAANNNLGGSPGAVVGGNISHANTAVLPGTLGADQVIIPFGAFDTKALACAATDYESNFGVAYYYTSDDYSTKASPSAAVGCSLTATQKAKTLQTSTGADAAGLHGYVIQQADAGQDYWWIDIPPMRIVDTEVTKGEEVKVRVAMVDLATNSICTKCTPICQCVFTIAKIGCEDVTITNTLVFPYFDRDDDKDASYWNGIALTNFSDKEGKATLHIYEADGDYATATVTVPPQAVVAKLLRDLGATINKTNDTVTVPAGSGKLCDSRAFIEVCTDFTADGFAMIANRATGESMGYLPRTNWTLPICNK